MVIAEVIEDISDIKQNHLMKGSIRYVQNDKTGNYCRKT